MNHREALEEQKSEKNYPPPYIEIAHAKGDGEDHNAYSLLRRRVLLMNTLQLATQTDGWFCIVVTEVDDLVKLLRMRNHREPHTIKSVRFYMTG